MNNFQELLKQIKENSQTQTKETKTTHDLLKKIAGNFKSFKAPKGITEDVKEEDKSFSLKDDFKKFKGELKDSLSFVKTNLLGIKPSEANIQKQSQVKKALSKDSPNIIDSPDEKIAEETKKQSRIIDQLLNTTRESLTQLKNIGKSLVGTPEPLKTGTPVPPPGMGAIGAGAVGAGAIGAGAMLPDINLPSKASAPDKSKPPAPDPNKKGGGKETAKAASKGIGKSLLKKIPVVGAVAGLAFGASRLMQGDVAGAGMEVASGLAGTIPGVGTAASIGIDAALAAKDAGAFEKEEAPAAPPPPPPKKEEAPAAPPPPPPPPPPPKLAKAEVKKASGVSEIKAEENLEQLQMAQGELQGIYKDYRDEKAKVSEKLAGDRKKYPEGFIDDPSDPEYPKELKAVDDKYKKLIDSQKKEVEKLSKAPGISEAKARQVKAEADEEDDDKEIAPAKTKSKVTGETSKTTSDTTVTGGGSTTTKMVLSEDAKKAEAESPGMSKRHQAEYSELRGKLESEGKLEGKSRREIMNMPEIKELRAKQDGEQDARGKRVTDGMTYEISKTSGENAAMKDEMSSSKGGQTAVMSNVSNNNQTTFMPVKGEPRPGSRGSALDRYSDRVAAY